MKQPKKMTLAEVRKRFGVDVSAVVAVLGPAKMGALIITAKGEAMEVEHLRGVMPTTSGLVVGTIADVKPTARLIGRQAHEAVANVRAVARMFADRPTYETQRALQDALDNLGLTLA